MTFTIQVKFKHAKMYLLHAPFLEKFYHPSCHQIEEISPTKMNTYIYIQDIKKLFNYLIKSYTYYRVIERFNWNTERRTT